jgi:phosphoglycerol transferase MdoB-like AlkP superfamily enzyme
MTQIGINVALITLGIIGLIVATSVVIVYAMPARNGWPLSRKVAVFFSLPILVVIWFVVMAYGASHMFDPVPGSRHTVTVEVPK